MLFIENQYSGERGNMFTRLIGVVFRVLVLRSCYAGCASLR